MKSVGIFICNYNKRDFVINCVKSILEQSFTDFDLYVVDNASTDDSVLRLKETYKDKITIIENKENLGGSGGFNTGIRRGMDEGYKYIMLVDNDTVFDKDAVYELFHFLEKNDDVGMAGATIYQMKNPDYIQEMGGKINWEKCNVSGINKGEKCSDKIPDIVDADHLAACALMVRRDVILKIGPIDEEYFIYWDDIEWGHRCRLNGYRCVAIKSAKVWHNASFLSNESLICKYYGCRNYMHFFAKYISEKDIEYFAEHMLSRVYKWLCGYYCKRQYDMLPIVIHALNDFMSNIRGKATIDIKVNHSNDDPLFCFIKASKKILLTTSNKLLMNKKNSAISFINKCKEINPLIQVYLIENEWNKDESRFFNLIDNVFVREDIYDNVFYLTKHVSDEKECLLPAICVDEYLNCIYDEDTYNIYSSLKSNEKIFINVYKKMFIESVKKIRD